MTLLDPNRKGTVTVCSPSGDVGYGFDEAAIAACVNEGVDAIAIQGTSTDPGPYYLGTGSSYIPESGVVADLEKLIPIALRAKVPLLVSVGGSGTDNQLTSIVDALRTWAVRAGCSFRLCSIRTSVNKETLTDLLTRGIQIPALQEAARHLGQTLTQDQVESASNIVAQVGPEPFISAIAEGADVIIAGRALDVSLYAAIPLMKGIPPEVALLMGKALECGGQVADPGSLLTGAVGTASADHFTVTPTDPDARCTPVSVMAHLLYEESSGTRLGFPRGQVDLSALDLTPIDSRTVSVSGAQWHASSIYTIKIEGARRIGFRAICLVGVHDTAVLGALPSAIASLQTKVESRFGLRRPIGFHKYGTAIGDSLNLGLLMDVVADDRQLASDIANFSKGYLMHFGFPGRKTTAGNLSMALSPNIIDVGPVFEFNIFHLVPVDDPEQLCTRTLENMGAR